jgi:MFS family permease
MVGKPLVVGEIQPHQHDDVRCLRLGFFGYFGFLGFLSVELQQQLFIEPERLLPPIDRMPCLLRGFLVGTKIENQKGLRHSFGISASHHRCQVGLLLAGPEQVRPCSAHPFTIAPKGGILHAALARWVYGKQPGRPALLPAMSDAPSSTHSGWLNRTVLGVGLTSLSSDWCHEMATAVLPALLLSLGAGAGWLGAIEGVADGLSSFVKLASGHWTDRLRRRKPLVVAAYGVTAAATGSLAFVSTALQVMAARSVAWFGRGLRTPSRKAILAAAASPETYGRAFGFERMMDTIGAIVAPVTAIWLLGATGHNYHRVFLWTLVPGAFAALIFAVLVREKPNSAPAGVSFFSGLRSLPRDFRWFLSAVGLFGLGDFSHTMLILYATRSLAPSVGMAAASSLAIGLYLLHNVFYAGFAYLGGWLSDRVRHRKFVLASGYAVAVLMALLLLLGPPHLPVLAGVFALAGIFVGVEEAIEDSIAAEMVPPEQHGMAFGTMAAVNAVGDFGSSALVGLLWSVYSPGAGFAAAGLLFAAGLILLLRLR